MPRDQVSARTVAVAFRKLALGAPYRNALRKLTGDDQNDPSQVYEVPMSGGAFVMTLLDGSRYRVQVTAEPPPAMKR